MKRHLSFSTVLLISTGIMLLLGLGLFTRAELARDRHAAEVRLQSELEAQAQLAEVAVMERVRKIDTALLFLRESYETGGASGFARVLNTPAATKLLETATGSLLTDARGQVLLSNGKPVTAELSVVDRGYFPRLRDSDDDRLVIDGPLMGRVSGRAAVVIARRVRAPDGGFGGVVGIGIEPGAMLSGGLPERTSRREILTLMSSDGVVLARSREHDRFLGTRIDDAALAALHAADVGYAVRASPTDGRMRAHALRKVRDLPLYVAVGDTFDGVEAQLAPRRHALLISVIAIGALLLLLLWLAWLYARRRTAQLRTLAGVKAQLELAQGIAGVGSWQWDVAHNRVNASRQVFVLMGVSTDTMALSLDSFIAYVPDSERPALIEVFRALLKRGYIEHEHHIRAPDGTLRLFLQCASVTERSDDGRALTVIGTCRDITAERRTQTLLAAREQRLEAIIDSLAEGVVVRDRNGRITLVNAAAARLSGKTREAMIGQHADVEIWKMFDEQGHPIAPTDYPAMRSIRTGTPIDQQLFGIRAKGQRPAWVSISTRLLAAEDSDTEDAVVASMADVTRVREAEREGRLAAAVFAQVSQPIVICDGDARVLRINRAFSESFGYSSEDMIGNKMNVLRSMRHDDAFYTEMWRQLQGEGYWRGEIWNRCKNGNAAPFLSSITRINEPVSRETRFVAVYANLHDQKQAEEALRWQADHDALTGLPNRQLLNDRLQSALIQARRKHARVAVAFIDLDRFKPINDNFGHLAGDFLLQILAERMRGVLRASDTLARVGGDEFIAVLGEVGDASGVRRALAALLNAVSEPVVWEDTTLNVGCSIGVAFWPDDADQPTELIEAADAAMYRAKAEGRGRIEFVGESSSTARHE